MKNKIAKTKFNIREFFESFIKALRRSDMIVLPGNLAFFFVLAIIPSLSLISYCASILNLSVSYIYNFIASSFSKEMADLILGVNLTNQSGVEFVIAIIVGLYVASNGADSMITASNTIYGYKNKPWLKRRIKALCMTFIIILLLIFMLIVPVFGNTITTLVEEVNLNQVITDRIITIFDLIQGPISWIVMYGLIAILYKVAPDEKRNNRVINYGAIFTTIAFIIGTKIYSIYVNNYVSYQSLYGGLANIVVLMIWIYYLSYVFTVGIALNVQKETSYLEESGTIKNKNE